MIVLVLIIFVGFIGLMCIRDYWYYWEDVIVGVLFGSAFAYAAWVYK